METRSGRRARLGLSALLGGMTALHLAKPQAFESMVPRWLPGDRRAWNLAAAAAEGTSAALLASPRTARAGGMAALATFLGVYPANVEAVRLGGYRGVPGWLGTRQAAVARLPFQLPLLWWAWRVAADARSS